MTDALASTPKKAWWAAVGMSIFVGLILLVTTIITQKMSGAPSSMGMSAGVAFVIGLVATFVGFMLSAGLLAWASHLLGFEKRGFIRGLGAHVSVNIALILPAIVLTALTPLINLGAVSVIYWLAYAGFIVLAFILMLHIFARAYGVTLGKAFGVWATSLGLLLSIFIAILLLVVVIAAPIGSSISNRGGAMWDDSYADFDLGAFEEFENLEADFDAAIDVQLDIEASSLAEEAEL